MDDVVITAGARTPFGKLGGALAAMSAIDLGAAVIREVVTRSRAPKERVGHVIMGTVVPAGLGQIPARQAAFKAGLPPHVPALSINKVCGSALKAVNLGAILINAGEAEIVVAGGMESMSNAPYLLDKARFGYRLGNGELIDAMIQDGLWSPTDHCHMGVYGSSGAREYEITRGQQDEWALRSQQRYATALAAGKFAEEIMPIEVPQPKGGTRRVDADEQPRPVTTLEKLAALKPAFEEEGTVTAGNAPGVNDGAAAVVVTSYKRAKELGVEPMARIVGQATSGVDPQWVMMAPVSGVRKLWAKTGWKNEDVDLYELNEAFSVQALGVMKELGLDLNKVNVNGGAVALGHPIGASGARVLVTLLYEMIRRDVHKGVAALCLGGGNSVAMAIER